MNTQTLQLYLTYAKSWIRLHSVQDPTSWDADRVADAFALLPTPPSFEKWVADREYFSDMVQRLIPVNQEPTAEEKLRINAVTGATCAAMKKKAPIQRR